MNNISLELLLWKLYFRSIHYFICFISLQSIKLNWWSL